VGENLTSDEVHMDQIGPSGITRFPPCGGPLKSGGGETRGEELAGVETFEVSDDDCDVFHTHYLLDFVPVL